MLGQPDNLPFQTQCPSTSSIFKGGHVPVAEFSMRNNPASVSCSLRRISIQKKTFQSKELRKSSTNTCSDSKASSTRFGTHDLITPVSCLLSPLQGWRLGRMSIESPQRKARESTEEAAKPSEFDAAWSKKYVFPELKPAGHTSNSCDLPVSFHPNEKIELGEVVDKPIHSSDFFTKNFHLLVG
jgi:hypothetical protein